MQKTLRATALVLALCCPVFAGDISNPSVTQPPPRMAEEEPTTAGDIPNPLPPEESETQSLMSMLESLLALF